MLSLDTAEPIIATPPRGVYDPVHFSDLKCMALSPAHYKASVSRRWESTRVMRLGTIGHHIVLGPHRTKPLIKYSGDERKGNGWKEFERATLAAHPGAEIVTATEWAAAEPMAAAVLADPIAREVLQDTCREVGVVWKSGGIECETDGIDAVGNGYLLDLKFTSCTEPDNFSRHAIKNNWHAQLAFYEEAANSRGLATGRGLLLIGVEPEPPYAVTVMRLTEAVADHGRRLCAKWLERLAVCRAEDHWPAYAQRVVDLEAPPWWQEDEEP